MLRIQYISRRLRVTRNAIKVVLFFLSAPPMTYHGVPKHMTVPAGGPLTQLIRELYSDTLYRVSVTAVTGAGPGTLVFVDGQTRPAARQ